MWDIILTAAINLIPWQKDITPNNPFDFDVGDKLAELSTESALMIKASKHKDIDNSVYFSDREAPNTDNCFTFSDNCKPDYIHHVFFVKDPQNNKWVYEIVFSYNWRVLKISNKPA